MTAIVTLTRYPDIFQRFRESVEKWEPAAQKIVVTSGGAEIDAPGWTMLPGIEPFIFARNANLGIVAAGNQDVLLVNDDCELTLPILAECERITREHPAIGLLSPQIAGGVGNFLQRVGAARPQSDYYVSPERLAFVCIYIPARTRRMVGLLDEGFDGYGGEDDDYCIRVDNQHLQLAVTPLVSIKHGRGSDNSMSSSYLRAMSLEERNRQMQFMLMRCGIKYGKERMRE